MWLNIHNIKFIILTIFKCTVSSHTFLMEFRFGQVADFEATNVTKKMKSQMNHLCLRSGWMLMEPWPHMEPCATLFIYRAMVTSHVSTEKQMLLPKEGESGRPAAKLRNGKAGIKSLCPAPWFPLFTSTLSCWWKLEEKAISMLFWGL